MCLKEKGQAVNRCLLGMLMTLYGIERQKQSVCKGSAVDGCLFGRLITTPGEKNDIKECLKNCKGQAVNGCSFGFQFVRVMTLPGHEDWVRGVHLTVDGKLSSVHQSVYLSVYQSMSVRLSLLNGKDQLTGHRSLVTENSTTPHPPNTPNINRKVVSSWIFMA